MPEFNKKSTALIILLFAVIISYGASVFGGFVWDDNALIVENDLIKDPGNIVQLLTTELHTGTGTNYYRPLESISLALDYRLFGLNPAGYHATNILIHFLVGLLVLLILLELTGDLFLSLIASVFFIIHPVHSEAVAYISGRADLLAALFILLSFFLYLKFINKRQHCSCGNKLYYFLSIFFLPLALLSKEYTVVFIIAIFTLDVFFCNDKRSIFFRLAPFVLVSGIYLYLRSGVFNFSSGPPLISKKEIAISTVGFIERLFLFLKSLVIYIGEIIVPVNLHMERYQIFEKTVFIFLFAAAIFIFLLIKAKKHLKEQKRLVVFFCLWFFIWLIPQSAFVFPGRLADHFLYLPSVAVFFLLALMLASLENKKVSCLIFILATVYFSVFTGAYSKKWNNEISLFEWISECEPRNLKIRNNLADAYFKSGMKEESLKQYFLMLYPYANTLREENFILEGEKMLESPLLKDKYTRIEASQALYNIGVIFDAQDKLYLASAAYRYSLVLNPAYGDALNNLGVVYGKMKLPNEAVRLFKRAIDSDCLNVKAYNNLAVALASMGRLSEAISLWRKALEINPGYEPAKKNMQLIDGNLAKGHGR